MVYGEDSGCWTTTAISVCEALTIPDQETPSKALKTKLKCSPGVGSSEVALNMAEPSWQEHLRLRLAERNARESAFASIIEQC